MLIASCKQAILYSSEFKPTGIGLHVHWGGREMRSTGTAVIRHETHIARNKNLIRRILWRANWICLLASIGIGLPKTNAQVIFFDDFEGNTFPVFDPPPMPVAGNDIPQNDQPWGVNTSGIPAKWGSSNNPFPMGSFYAYLNDHTNGGGLGTRFLAADDDTDPNGIWSQITGQVTTFSFDFWEPIDVLGDDIGDGFSVGYSNADDMNSSERSFRALLNNGQLVADNAIGASPVTYALEEVHRVFMVANDSASPVSNYRDGRTLGSLQADVWISLSGADPIFAFTLNQSNPNPQSAGFRSFTGEIQELLIDNVGIFAGVDFSGIPDAGERLGLTVNTVTGQITLENNSEEVISLNSYRITSPGESLNATGWDPIAAQSIPGFPSGNGSGNGWEAGPNSDAAELAEYYLLGESTLNIGSSINLGTAYDGVVDAQDLRFDYAQSDGSIIRGFVEYVSSLAADFDNDGDVDGNDLGVWQAAYGVTNAGDADGDGDSDGRDFLTWQRQFGSGLGPISAVHPVPEPSAVAVLCLSAGAVSCFRQSGKKGR
jgi:hypothetical protein